MEQNRLLFELRKLVQLRRGETRATSRGVLGAGAGAEQAPFLVQAGFCSRLSRGCLLHTYDPFSKPHWWWIYTARRECTAIFQRKFLIQLHW